MCTYACTIFSCEHLAWGRKVKPCLAGDYQEGTLRSDCARKQPHGLQSRRVDESCERCRQSKNTIQEARAMLKDLRSKLDEKRLDYEGKETATSEKHLRTKDGEDKPASEQESSDGSSSNTAVREHRPDDELEFSQKDSGIGLDGVYESEEGWIHAGTSTGSNHQTDFYPSPAPLSPIKESFHDSGAAEMAEKIFKLKAHVGACLEVLHSRDSKEPPSDAKVPSPKVDEPTTGAPAGDNSNTGIMLAPSLPKSRLPKTGSGLGAGNRSGRLAKPGFASRK